MLINQECIPNPKPIKQEKVKKQLGFGKKPKKEQPDWKVGILSHHHSNPSKADRAVFPTAVVAEAKVRSKGICEHCHASSCTQSHHVMSRGRSGRGVLSNAYRCCGVCHMAIEASEEKKQEIISLYEMKFGQFFYFDELDFNEQAIKQAKESESENAKLIKEERLEPIVELLTAATGRTLKAKELRLLDSLGVGEMQVFAKLMQDVVQTGLTEVAEPSKPSFGYGEFND